MLSLANTNLDSFLKNPSCVCIEIILLRQEDTYLSPLDRLSASHVLRNCYKLYSACISTISGPVFLNQVALESPKWGLSVHMWEVQERQQMTKISGHQ